MSTDVNPLVPRPIDLPSPVPLNDLGDLTALDEAKIFAAPSNPADWPRWREVLHSWREDARSRINYRGDLYRRPASAWAARCYTVAQVWLWDELLYSFDEHRFTPERFLADAERFGGLDAVVLWHAYPVIGIDDRNQWDHYRDVPGIRQLVRDLHAAGVRVFVDYNPWDVGTRRGGDDATELAALLGDLAADGVFLDTLKKAEPDLVARIEEARPGAVLEGESKLAIERIDDHALSWAQFFADSEVPGVLRAHWLERRHMQHHIRRWHRDHSEELQSAWLNGSGVMIWEVVFGVWVGWSRRDAATVRRMATIQRVAAELLLEGEWTPLASLLPEAHQGGIYASTFAAGGVTLWALVNRESTDYVGAVLPNAGGRLVDLTSGRWVEATDGVAVPARGIGALLQLADGAAEPAWLASVRDLASSGRLAHDPDAAFPHRIARRRPVPDAEPVQRPPAEAVVVPAGDWVLTVRYRARETGMYQGAPYVDEWKPLPPRLHDPRTLQRSGAIPRPVAVAVREVTNDEFAAFLAASGYAPAVRHRFLEHWEGGAAGSGIGDQPVTYVDLDDARAYCAWRGGRLPTEDEWQLAGASPAGLVRVTPSVWNWTESEHTDGRSRFVMLKGGSAYRAEGSQWYLEGGVQPPEVSVKLLLPGLGVGRSSTIGFRCAWELTDSGEATR